MTSLFDRLAPLEIEVGSGKGLFLDTAAAEFPDHNYLGIEVARRYARFTAARLARGQRTNARVLEGDAEQLSSSFWNRIKCTRCMSIFLIRGGKNDTTSVGL